MRKIAKKKEVLRSRIAVANEYGELTRKELAMLDKTAEQLVKSVMRRVKDPMKRRLQIEWGKTQFDVNVSMAILKTNMEKGAGISAKYEGKNIVVRRKKGDGKIHIAM